MTRNARFILTPLSSSVESLLGSRRTASELNRITNHPSRYGYCQVSITSSPPALMILCIIAIAVADSSKNFNFKLRLVMKRATE
jgi:hypothetical protein